MWRGGGSKRLSGKARPAIVDVIARSDKAQRGRRCARQADQCQRVAQALAATVQGECMSRPLSGRFYG
jgi:hypothetical protein